MKLLTLLCLVLAPVTVACGGDDVPVVSQSSLEDEVMQQMTEYAGVAPDKIECPEDGLRGEVGENVRCTLFAGGDTVGITVTVKSVDGTTVDFDIEADDEVNQG
jgi:hypothetical protein